MERLEPIGGYWPAMRQIEGGRYCDLKEVEAELARKDEEIDRLCWIIQEAYDAKDREEKMRILGDVLKEDAVAAAIVRQARARGKIK